MGLLCKLLTGGAWFDCRNTVYIDYVNVYMQTITHLLWISLALQKTVYLFQAKCFFSFLHNKKLKAVIVDAGRCSKVTVQQLDCHWRRRGARLAGSQQVECVSRLFRHSLTWLSNLIRQLVCTATDFKNTISYKQAAAYKLWGQNFQIIFLNFKCNDVLWKELCIWY